MIKRIDFDKFTKENRPIEVVGESGKIYKLTKMSAGRMSAWEQAWAKAEFNMTPAECFKALFSVREALSKNDVYKASIMTDRVLTGMARIADGKPHHWLEIFSIFFCADGEDVGELTEETTREKCHDLRHYDAEDLFILAGSLMPGFMNDYEESKKIFSENQAATTKPANENNE